MIKMRILAEYAPLYPKPGFGCWEQHCCNVYLLGKLIQARLMHPWTDLAFVPLETTDTHRYIDGWISVVNIQQLRDIDQQFIMGFVCWTCAPFKPFIPVGMTQP